MFSEAKLVSNGQSLSGDEGKAVSAKPLRGCGTHQAGSTAFLPLITDRHSLELE